MGFFDRFRGVRKVELERKEPQITRDNQKTSQQIRTAWEGARVDNLVSGWLTSTVPINQQLETALRSLRARSRQLAKNDPYVVRFLQLARQNTIGSSGLDFRSTVKRANGNPSKNERDAINSAWAEAIQPGVLCAKEKFSFNDFCNLASDQLGYDGEVIIIEQPGGPFGVQFRFIDPELLDVNFNEEKVGRPRVRMGIETNKAGKVVAYHLHSTDATHASYYTRDGRGYIRVDASQIIHAFRTEYVDQLRGFPPTAAAMLRLRMLNGYEEAELVGARGGASMMGFVIRGESGKGFEGEGTIVSSDEPGSGEANLIAQSGSSQSPTIEAEAGSFHYLEHGADVKTFDPNHPSGAYQQFIKTVLRGIAAGLGVSYNTLANDLEGVNFSSIRAGVLEDREAWKARQEFIIQNIASNIFGRWLRAALLRRKIKLPRGLALNPADVGRLRAHTFQGRRWPWVDPQKDMTANKTAVDEGFRSRSDVIRESGRDPMEVFEEIAEENKLLEEMGIKVGGQPAPVEPESDELNGENENDETEDE